MVVEKSQGFLYQDFAFGNSLNVLIIELSIYYWPVILLLMWEISPFFFPLENGERKNSHKKSVRNMLVNVLFLY